MFIGGLCLIFASVATGEADLSLLVVFPVVSGTGGVFLLGMGLTVAGLLLGFALIAIGQAGWANHQGSARTGESRPNHTRSESKGTRYGGVVLIGPIPIAFGSDLRMAATMLIVGIIIAMVVLALILGAFD